MKLQWAVSRSAASIAIMALLAAPAFATDLALPMPVKAPPVKAPIVSAPNWAGWYVGVNGGYGWGRSGGQGTVDPRSVTLAPGWEISGPVPAPYGFSIDDPKGGFGGIQLGRLWQADRLVYGLEADFDFSGIKGRGSAPINFAIDNPDEGNFVGTSTLTQKLEWFGTLRGRLGYDINPLLIYVTGGLAVGHIKSTLDLTGSTLAGPANDAIFIGTTNNSASSETTHFGYAVGAGGEWRIARDWSVRGEYLFMSLEDKGSLAVPGATATNLGMDVHMARAALNYRFGGY